MANSRYIAIVEDEKEQSELLKQYLYRFAKEQEFDLQVSQFYDLQSFRANGDSFFDLIFLDIRLPDGNGMEMAREIRKTNTKTQIVFVTSLSHYAVNGYEVGACDYILKPVSYDNFSFKFKRIRELMEQKRNVTITVRNPEGMRIIDVSDIMYIEVERHTIRIHTESEIVETSGSLSNYYQMLKSLPFEYCNQSYLVNLEYVNGIREDEVLVGKERIRMSRPKKKSFIECVNRYIGI